MAHDLHSMLTRRDLLRRTAAVAGAAFVMPGMPGLVMRPTAAALQQDALSQRRAQMGAAPIAVQKLSDRLTMLSGPGGNVVVLDGGEGKVLADCFVLPAWDSLAKTLATLSAAPVKAVIDTHWHFDHVDNNANLRKAGAAVVAHENTRKRMSESHKVLGMDMPPSPPDALPTQTFASQHKMDANGEQIVLGYVPPAHTDTDIYIHYTRGDVIHLGDLYFSGMYPFFDATTGGRINGMIAAADMILKMVDDKTRIVPGHGPLSDKAGLTEYRDVMVTARDRVQKLKGAGRTLDEVIAANPTKDLDAVWGKGFMDPKSFVTLVYNTL